MELKTTGKHRQREQNNLGITLPSEQEWSTVIRAVTVDHVLWRGLSYALFTLHASVDGSHWLCIGRSRNALWVRPFCSTFQAATDPSANQTALCKYKRKDTVQRNRLCNATQKNTWIRQKAPTRRRTHVVWTRRMLSTTILTWPQSSNTFNGLKVVSLIWLAPVF